MNGENEPFCQWSSLSEPVEIDIILYIRNCEIESSHLLDRSNLVLRKRNDSFVSYITTGFQFSDFELNKVCEEICSEKTLECITSCDSTNSECYSTCLRAEIDCFNRKIFSLKHLTFEKYNWGPRLTSLLISKTDLPFYIKWRQILLHSPLIISFNQFQIGAIKTEHELSHFYTQWNHRLIPYLQSEQ